MPLAINEHILGLHVPVDDPHLVRRAEATESLHRDHDNQRWREAAARLHAKLLGVLAVDP